MLLTRLTFTKIACIKLMCPSVILFACHFMCKVTREQLASNTQKSIENMWVWYT